VRLTPSSTELVRAIHGAFAASLALVAARVRLTAALLVTAGQAKARIVQRRHATLNSLDDTIDGNIGVELQQGKPSRIE
jgi:hypothetical protein